LCFRVWGDERDFRCEAYAAVLVASLERSKDTNVRQRAQLAYVHDSCRSGTCGRLCRGHGPLPIQCSISPHSKLINDASFHYKFDGWFRECDGFRIQVQCARFHEWHVCRPCVRAAQCSTHVTYIWLLKVISSRSRCWYYSESRLILSYNMIKLPEREGMHGARTMTYASDTGKMYTYTSQVRF
jgi:hypothetical protein